MGACLSTHESGQSCAPHLHKGPAPFDSVWSVAEKQQTQQHKHQKKHKGSTKTASKHVPQQQQAQQQQKQKRRPQVDITTGEVIPDFGVHGVFDVLYELGSGGSGQTYLCRCVLMSAVPLVYCFQAATAITYCSGLAPCQRVSLSDLLPQSLRWSSSSSRGPI